MPRSSGGGSHSGGSHSSSGSHRSYSSGGGSHRSGYSGSSSHSSYSRSGYSSASSHSSYSRSGYSNASNYSSRTGSESNRSQGSSSSYAGSRSTISAGHYRPDRSRTLPNKSVREERITTPCVSDSYFRGAQRYVYYRDQKPHYIYSNHETLKSSGRNVKKLLGWIAAILILGLGLIDVLVPTPLKEDYDTKIVIEDEIGVIENQNTLMEALVRFRDESGITPAIRTITHETWQKHYEYLDDYAFDDYVNSFTDERHWLIVYAQPEQPDPEFNDWAWEGIQGDDTVNLITERVADFFGTRLQKYLTTERISVGEALTKAFNETVPEMMQIGGEYEDGAIPGACVFLFLMLIAGLWHSGFLSFRKKNQNRPAAVPEDAVRVRLNSEEKVCAYCGGKYPEELTKCPNCGANLT